MKMRHKPEEETETKLNQHPKNNFHKMHKKKNALCTNCDVLDVRRRQLRDHQRQQVEAWHHPRDIHLVVALQVGVEDECDCGHLRRHRPVLDDVGDVERGVGGVRETEGLLTIQERKRFLSMSTDRDCKEEEENRKRKTKNEK
jgi:hypothetical protein